KLVQLLLHLLVGHGGRRPTETESAHAIELQLRPKLEVKLEAQRLAFLELEMMNVRLRRDLVLLAVDHFLKCFLHELFDDFLSNRFPEFLLDDRRRSLAGTEARQADRGGVFLRGAVFGVSDGLDGHFHVDEPFETFAALGGNLDIHSLEPNYVSSTLL